MLRIGIKMSFEIKVCKDKAKILEFLYAIDETLPVPLSVRVDMDKFAEECASNITYAIEDGGKLVSCCMFYYNFENKPYAYFDLLATVAGYGGRGYAGALMTAAENAAREAGMVEFHLHTNKENERAVSIYKSRGYVIIATEPKLHMAKKL